MIRAGATSINFKSNHNKLDTTDIPGAQSRLPGSF